MTPENVIKAEIVQIAVHEAGPSAGYDQMAAIACVLRNRLKKGWQGGSWQEIIRHAGEVAPLEDRPRSPVVDLTRPDIRRLLADVDDIYSGMFKDTFTGIPEGTGTVLPAAKKIGGLYYADALWQDFGVLRPWFQSKILNDPANHPRIAQVGTLYIFS